MKTIVKYTEYSGWDPNRGGYRGGQCPPWGPKRKKLILYRFWYAAFTKLTILTFFHCKCLDINSLYVKKKENLSKDDFTCSCIVLKQRNLHYIEGHGVSRARPNEGFRGC